MTRAMKNSGVEWIGKIPAHWQMSKYKYFARSGMGETILGEQLVDKGVPVYSATQSDKLFGYVKKSSLSLTVGDIIIPARGNSIGCVTRVQENLATCTQTTIYSKITGIDAKYIYYTALGLKEHWFAFVDTAIPQITVKQIQNNSLPVPPATEQQAISDYLDDKCSAIDTTIAKQRDIIEHLREYKNAVITETVCHGLDPDTPMKDSGIEWIGKIPKHWQTCLLQWYGYFINGFAFNSQNMQLDNDIPVVRIGDIQNGLLNYETCLKTQMLKTLNEYLLKQRDIVIAMSGATSGKTAYKDDAVLAYVNQRVGIIRCQTKYPFYCLNTHGFKQYVNLLSAGSAQPNISAEQIMHFCLPVLPLSEQQAIAKYLDEKCGTIDSVIAKQEHLIELLTEYKHSLIYECVTGKKEVANV